MTPKKSTRLPAGADITNRTDLQRTYILPELEKIPCELRELHRWVVWKGKKVPYCATAVNRKASVTNPDTWATFDQARTKFEDGGYDGIGFVLNGDGIVGVDLDDCVTDGVPSEAALHLIRDCIGCQYIELSPSGTGLRGFGYGPNITGRRGQVDGVKVELYANRRYLTVTGRVICAGPLVKLPGFTDVAEIISKRQKSASPQTCTEDAQETHATSVSSVQGVPIGKFLPSGEGERNRCVFALARYLRGRCPHATPGELRPIVARWHELALPVIRTKHFDETWGDFVYAYKNVRQPHGQILDGIVRRIDYDEPLPSSIDASWYGSAGIRLIHICMALQQHQGDEPFFLSARQAGELLGMNYRSASRLLSQLVGDNVLELVSIGRGDKASRYRFVGGASDAALAA